MKQIFLVCLLVSMSIHAADFLTEAEVSEKIKAAYRTGDRDPALARIIGEYSGKLRPSDAARIANEAKLIQTRDQILISYGYYNRAILTQAELQSLSQLGSDTAKNTILSFKTKKLPEPPPSSPNALMETIMGDLADMEGMKDRDERILKFAEKHASELTPDALAWIADHCQTPHGKDMVLGIYLASEFNRLPHLEIAKLAKRMSQRQSTQAIITKAIRKPMTPVNGKMLDMSQIQDALSIIRKAPHSIEDLLFDFFYANKSQLSSDGFHSLQDALGTDHLKVHLLKMWLNSEADRLTVTDLQRIKHSLQNPVMQRQSRGEKIEEFVDGKLQEKQNEKTDLGKRLISEMAAIGLNNRDEKIRDLAKRYGDELPPTALSFVTSGCISAAGKDHVITDYLESQQKRLTSQQITDLAKLLNSKAKKVLWTILGLERPMQPKEGSHLSRSQVEDALHVIRQPDINPHAWDELIERFFNTNVAALDKDGFELVRGAIRLELRGRLANKWDSRQSDSSSPKPCGPSYDRIAKVPLAAPEFY